MHENIRKEDPDIRGGESSCPWLLRSPETVSYDLLEVDGDWTQWTGEVSDGASFRTTCNNCDSEAECNFHGTCSNEGICECYTDKNDIPLFVGTHCKFDLPCAQLKGNNNDTWDVIPVTRDSAWTAYGRGVYAADHATLNKTIPDEDAVILLFSGSRWFGAYYEGGMCFGFDWWYDHAKELHSFWDKTYTELTRYVSEPTLNSDPIAVDFYEIGRRGKKYGPLGELIPLQDPPGSGYFDCVDTNMTLLEILSQRYDTDTTPASCLVTNETSPTALPDEL